MRCRVLGGGTINQVFAVELASGERLCIKVQQPGSSCPGMFEAEAAALKRIAASNTIRVPDTLFADSNCLIQNLFTQGAKSATWHEVMGRGLAQMHLAIQAKQFGFCMNNYLGTSEQSNLENADWLTFWRNNRVQPQVKRLVDLLGVDDKLIKQLDKLSERLEYYLRDNAEPPVFVHGDLWSGNASADEHGLPIIYDPASYFASREVEFGMMRLFGGFGTSTEAAYQEVWPLQSGCDERIELYRLYHILNHLLIFGHAYYAQASESVASLL